MPWARIDDQFYMHPKVQKAWHDCTTSVGLHVLALSHCASYLTDGHVSEVFVKTLIPSVSLRKKAIQALLDAGMWDAAETGWQIHDYLDFNESRERVLHRRAADSKRKRSGIGVES